MSPAKEYTRRAGLREERVRTLGRLHDQVAIFRLSVAGLTLAAAWWSLQQHAFAPSWLLLGVAVFGALVLLHHRVRSARSQAERAVAFYRKGLERIENRWTGTGRDGARFNDPHHVYASDLDLFGPGGLFELLCAVRTRMGETKLAAWLSSPAPLAAIRERHAAIVELRDRLDLREDLAVLGADDAVGVHPDELLAWAGRPNRLVGRWLRWCAVLLPVAAAASALFWWVRGIGSPFFLVVLIEAAVLYALRSALAEALNGSEAAFDDLGLFAELLTRVERERFAAGPLGALMAKLSSPTGNASTALRRLSTITGFAGARRNQAIALLSVPLMYPLVVALAAERWRRQYGEAVPVWVEVLAELEAQLSLAGYSHEHPQDPFPQFIEGPPEFVAAELGHPLIADDSCVRNDVRVVGETRILLVSGSNMSGKSTLLRTVGINAVLAMAGAPVRARALRLTELQVGASIRINDSLHEGSSRFYAEITRLRQLFDLAAGTRPLLFLLDELLQGTNSWDRKSGAEGIVRAFAARGAIGLISTHDLALTEISGLAADTLRNVHFQDEWSNGRMTFDFRLRDGVVTRSNALELMRSVGLEV